VGHAPQPLSPEAAAALLAIDVVGPNGQGHRIPVGEVQVRVGDRVVLSAWAGAEPVPQGAQEIEEPA
jgi:co-chaperonin GroES (HSP10)